MSTSNTETYIEDSTHWMTKMAGLPEIHACILGGMKMKRELDLEWVELVKQALDAGITKNEIREFLQNHGTKAEEYKIV
jgi:Anti-repressor SinI